MKTSIYDRIPTMKTAELRQMIGLWAWSCDMRERKNGKYYERCLARALEELRKRIKNEPLPHRG